MQICHAIKNGPCLFQFQLNFGLIYGGRLEHSFSFFSFHYRYIFILLLRANRFLRSAVATAED